MKNNTIQNLIQNRNNLFLRFMNENEINLPAKHAQIIDQYFCQWFETSVVNQNMVQKKIPFAIIALGGYGRKEQCIHSDIDLLILFNNSIPHETELLIQDLVYPLWDIGCEVGHATRTINESIKLSSKDIEVLMSLLDGRFICGDKSLFFSLKERLRKKVIRYHTKQLIKMLVDHNLERHNRFGDSSFLIEPNLKEGQGGLRDFHTMCWIANIKSNINHPSELECFGYLSEKEYVSVNNAVSFIHQVRNRLHYIAKRKCDRLYFEYQMQLGKNMTSQTTNDMEQVELFLGELHGHMDILKQQYTIFLAELGYLKTFKTRRYIFSKQTSIKGLTVNPKNMLEFVSLELLLEKSNLLMDIFVESARLKLPLSASAKRIINDFIYLVNDDFRKNPEMVKGFEKVLSISSGTFNVLQTMLQTGFLIAFIPEFKSIQNLTQYNEYHIYPVDKHSLKTVQIAKQFSEDQYKKELFHRIYKAIDNKIPLLWACLLHDIGKGEKNDNHAESGTQIAKTILERVGISSEEKEIILFLIQEHLFLIKTATRRDIQDEETSVFCARKIRNIHTLNMLYLLTVADSKATGPKAWNDWNASLLSNLFFNILNILNKGEFATTEAVDAIEKKKRFLLSFYEGQEIAQHIESYLSTMSLRYVIYVSEDQMPNHIQLYNQLKDAAFVWDIQKDSHSNTRIVTICAKNKPGLFSKIAGVFTLNDLDILDAQIYTWKNDVVLDIFHVSPPKDQIFEDEKWKQVETLLFEALTYNINLNIRLQDRMMKNGLTKQAIITQPIKINVDNESSGFYTIIEVFSYDFPGLLFMITDTLFKCGIDIYTAKIATKLDQVVDIFYVRNFFGQKIVTEDQVLETKNEIYKVLSNRMNVKNYKFEHRV